MSSSLSRRLADEGIDPRGMTLGGSAFQSFADFEAAGGAAVNPGPVWIDGKLLKDMLSTGDSFTYSKQIGIVTKTTSNPFCLHCIGVSGAII